MYLTFGIALLYTKKYIRQAFISIFLYFVILYNWWCSIMYKSSGVADRIKRVAKYRGITVRSMLEDLSMSLNTLVNMKGSMPRADTLAKIADYLQCSVDYLLERTEEIPTAGTGQQAPSLPENSREMITLFEQLPERQQLILIGRLQEMVAPMAPDDTIETAAPRHDEGKAV